MSEAVARRGFLLQLLGLAGAGAAAGLAIGRTLKAERRASSPTLYFNGRYWHTHETIDQLVGTWDIRWCSRPVCAHSLEQIGTIEDARRVWHLRKFHCPPRPLPGEGVPPAAPDQSAPLRRYYLHNEG
ncbi:MAG TPA: hypothetical protein VMN04_08860 [Thermoanaerobaculia bacterium]|nr:hypothetical protein [Thermoanaerobaculia bacterium]